MRTPRSRLGGPIVAAVTVLVSAALGCNNSHVVGQRLDGSADAAGRRFNR